MRKVGAGVAHEKTAAVRLGSLSYFIAGRRRKMRVGLVAQCPIGRTLRNAHINFVLRGEV